MYRIRFVPKLGMWVVEILQFHAFWVASKCPGSNKETLKFADLIAAEQWVSMVGLDRAYRRQAGHWSNVALPKDENQNERN